MDSISAFCWMPAQDHSCKLLLVLTSSLPAAAQRRHRRGPFRVVIGVDPGRKVLYTAVKRVAGQPERKVRLTTKAYRRSAGHAAAAARMLRMQQQAGVLP